MLVVLAEQQLAYPHGADATKSPSSPKQCMRRPTKPADLATVATTVVSGRCSRADERFQHLDRRRPHKRIGDHAYVWAGCAASRRPDCQQAADGVEA
jgi:hypothetical protein